MLSLTEYKISNNFVIFIIPHLYKYTSRKKSYPHAFMIGWLKKVSKEFFPTFQLRSLRWIKKLISIEDISRLFPSTLNFLTISPCFSHVFVFMSHCWWTFWCIFHFILQNWLLFYSVPIPNLITQFLAWYRISCNLNEEKD